MWKRTLNFILLASCSGVPLQESVTSKPFICSSSLDSDPLKEERGVDSDSEIATRSFLMNQDKRWPLGIVPYELDSAFGDEEVKMIKASMRIFSDSSCVRWVPRNKQHDYVKIIHSQRKGLCNSRVGRKGGMQPLNLSKDCFNVKAGYRGAITHEMMHAIGFIHEQQRIDRECFVKVAKHIAMTSKYDYGITKDTETRFPYDFGSIMHYGNNENMRGHGGEKLGNFEGKLTDMDKWKLNSMYCGAQTYCEVYPDNCQKFLSVQNSCNRRSNNEQ